MEIIIGVVLCIVALLVAINKYFKPVKIGYKITWRNWLFPNLLTLPMLMWLMLQEIAWCLKLESSDYGLEWLIAELLRNGLGIICIIVILMRTYDWAAEITGLDKSVVYNETIKKVYFTMASLFACAFIWVIIYPDWESGDREAVRPYASRVVVWMINILGVWLDFKPQKEWFIKVIWVKIKNFVKNIKKISKLYAGFIVTILCTGVWLVAYAAAQHIVEVALNIIIAVLLTIAATYWILNWFHLPGKWSSKMRLDFKFNKIFDANTNYIKGHYGRVTYFLLKDSKELLFIIVGENVIWNGYKDSEDNSIDDLFGQCFEKYSLKGDKNAIRDEIESKLKDISEKRKIALNNAHIRAEERWEEENENAKKMKRVCE